jgi:hypothetical protein
MLIRAWLSPSEISFWCEKSSLFDTITAEGMSPHNHHKTKEAVL